MRRAASISACAALLVAGVGAARVVADVSPSVGDGSTVSIGESIAFAVSDSYSGNIPNGAPYASCGSHLDSQAQGRVFVAGMGPGGTGGTGWVPISVSCTGTNTWTFSGTVSESVPADAPSSVWASVAVQETVPIVLDSNYTVNYSGNFHYPLAASPTSTTATTSATTTVPTVTAPTTTVTITSPTTTATPGTTTVPVTTATGTPPPPPATTVVQTVTQPVAASKPPAANFTAALVGHDRVQFTDTSSRGTAPIASHAWQFGDGSAASRLDPTHTYGAPGDFYVTELVVDAAGLTSVAVHKLTMTAGTLVLGPRQVRVPASKQKAKAVPKHKSAKTVKKKPKTR